MTSDRREITAVDADEDAGRHGGYHGDDVYGDGGGDARVNGKTATGDWDPLEATQSSDTNTILNTSVC